MSRCVLRFLFDAGSETCLWAANEEARRRFGDSWVDLDALPLPAETLRRLAALVQRYDESIDWDDPGGPSPWTPAEQQEFTGEARAVLALLRSELGGEFDVVDEARTAPDQRDAPR